MTAEASCKLKFAFNNICSFYIIDVDDMVKSSGLDIANPAHKYLINSEIKRLISAGAKSKRYLGIIYVNSRIDCDSIVGLKRCVADMMGDESEITFFVLDDYDAPSLKPYYRLFDEVMFFPTFKKSKVIKCKR